MKRDGEGVGTHQARPAVAATPVSAPGAVWRIIVLSHRAPAFRTLMLALPGDREREADDRQTNRDGCQNADDKGAVFVTHGHAHRDSRTFRLPERSVYFIQRQMASHSKSKPVATFSLKLGSWLEASATGWGIVAVPAVVLLVFAAAILRLLLA